MPNIPGSRAWYAPRSPPPPSPFNIKQMRSSYMFSLIILFSIGIGCQQHAEVDADDGISTISADSIKQHIAVLASDSFLGRKPCTAGETKTVAYLRQQFTAAGLEPGNGNSYVQEVPMVNILAKATEQMLVQSPTKSFTLKALDDYIIWTDKPDPQVLARQSRTCFCRLRRCGTGV